MFDRDIYYTNQNIEDFLESLHVKRSKDYSPIKVYISTASPHNHWLQKLYNFYNNTDLME